MLAKILGVILIISGIGMVGYTVWMIVFRLGPMVPTEDFAAFERVIEVEVHVLEGCIVALFLISGIGLLSLAKRL